VTPKIKIKVGGRGEINSRDVAGQAFGAYFENTLTLSALNYS
jgi:hypothetical protein